MNSKEFIEVALSNNTPMEIGKFLVPEFIKDLQITIDDLKLLKPLTDSLDDLHKYEKVIYDAYITNNNFYLTEEQLQNAYDVYLKFR